MSMKHSAAYWGLLSIVNDSMPMVALNAITSDEASSTVTTPLLPCLVAYSIPGLSLVFALIEESLRVLGWRSCQSQKHVRKARPAH